LQFLPISARIEAAEEIHPKQKLENKKMAFSSAQILGMASITNAMNAHNKMVRESKVRINATGTEVMGNLRRVIVHDHPESGLHYSMSTRSGTPLFIEHSATLPKKWSRTAKAEIIAHFKRHNFTTLSL
jgi:hypothetical protein